MTTNTSLESPILAINIGNNLIQIGLSSSEDTLNIWHVSTPKAITTDEAGMILDTLKQSEECQRMFPGLRKASGAIVASVVPSLTDAWVQAARRMSDGRPLIVGPGLRTGLTMKYDNPAEIGADRIADLVAAYTLFCGAFIIVDLGTSTNFAIVDSQGIFTGGIIVPGLKLSAEALQKGAAQLYSVDLKAPAKVVGTNTRDAMRSGIIYGEVARIDGLIEMIWNELGYETKVLASGFGVSEIAALSRHITQTEENLTMRGLRILYSKNRKSRD